MPPPTGSPARASAHPAAAVPRVPTPARAQVAVVVLTQGNRPADLERALSSLQAQVGVELDVVVVGNGGPPGDLPAGIRRLELPHNLGIPAGRNAGVPLVRGELVFFLDDDARLLDDGLLAEAARRFADDPALGVIQPRVQAPDGTTLRRWVPRLRTKDARWSTPVTTLWEGAVVVRRDAFDAAGGWGAPYWYAHEGIELAWRVWDAGFTVWYSGDLRCEHPPVNPERHEDYYWNSARNRVWLARRNLPWALGVVYVASRTVIQLARSLPTKRGRDTLHPWWRGWVAGWTEDPGPRRRMRWSTVVRMARQARPPLV